MTPPSDDESDRAAILARRQRFIAIALSGLASTTACTAPQPCLNIAAPPHDGKDPEPRPQPQPEPQPTDTAAPQACLEVAPPQACLNVAPPQACLKVARPPDGKAAPRPCLKVRPPDDNGTPRPCLDVSPPDPEPTPAPTPCLRIAKPK